MTLSLGCPPLRAVKDDEEVGEGGGELAGQPPPRSRLIVAVPVNTHHHRWALPREGKSVYRRLMLIDPNLVSYLRFRWSRLTDSHPVSYLRFNWSRMTPTLSLIWSSGKMG